MSWKNYEKPTGKKQRSNDTNLYVKNFGKDMTETKLCQLFAPFGIITSCKIETDSTRQSRGFGFVNFERSEMAQRAMEKLNGYPIDDNQHLYVGPFQRKAERVKQLRQMQEENKEQRSDNLCLYISNLDMKVDEKSLEEIFSAFGKVNQTHIMRHGSESKGIGFVSFNTTEEATRALNEMNGKWIFSKPIYLRLSNNINTTTESISSAPSNITRPTVLPTSYSNYPPTFHQSTIMVPRPLTYWPFPATLLNSQVQSTIQYPSQLISPSVWNYYSSPMTLPHSRMQSIVEYPYPPPLPNYFNRATNQLNSQTQSIGGYPMSLTRPPLMNIFPSSTYPFNSQTQSTKEQSSSPSLNSSSSSATLPISPTQSAKESSSLSPSPQTTMIPSSTINQTKRQPYPYTPVKSDDE